MHGQKMKIHCWLKSYFVIFGKEERNLKLLKRLPKDSPEHLQPAVLDGMQRFVSSMPRRYSSRSKLGNLRIKKVYGPIKSYKIKQKRSEEHTSELQSRGHLVCRLLLEKKKEEH